MKRLFAILAALLGLAGCSTVAGINQQLLDQARPKVLRDPATGEAYLWMRGMVPTVVLRLMDLDADKPKP